MDINGLIEQEWQLYRLTKRNSPIQLNISLSVLHMYHLVFIVKACIHKLVASYYNNQITRKPMITIEIYDIALLI